MRELVTTLLELVGLVAIVVAAALYVARFGLPFGVLTFGLGLLAVSLLLAFTAPKVPAREDLE